MTATIDITGKIGPLIPKQGAIAPMYSYDRPAYMLWNAIVQGLVAEGWSESDAVFWLQSKGPRWELDGKLGDTIESLGMKWAKNIAKDYTPEFGRF